jgi:hypothetical protein
MEKIKLGIVVVYLVKEDNERLLDLHLGQIEKCTRVPYAIYGSANRLLPKFRKKLEQNPRVKICECRHAHLTGIKEHSFYLEQLVNYAIEDGSSHIVVFHVDSFPISPGWFEKAYARLSESCVLVAIMNGENFDEKPHSSFMFFHRDFYLKYGPAFLLSGEEFSSRKYKEYCRKFNHILEGGVGYGFKIYSEGLSWYPLRRSNRGKDHSIIGSIYDDIIFHLGAAQRNAKHHNKAVLKFDSQFKRRLFSLFPESIIGVLKWGLLKPKMILYSHIFSKDRKDFNAVRTQLLEDSESYINFLRTGER